VPTSQIDRLAAAAAGRAKRSARLEATARAALARWEAEELVVAARLRHVAKMKATWKRKVTRYDRKSATVE
jgi:hypothetical protein